MVNQVGAFERGMWEGEEMRWWWARRSSHIVGGFSGFLVLVGGGKMRVLMKDFWK